MIFIIVIIVAITLLFLWHRSETNLPPGPRGIPLLGYFPFLGANQVATIQELSKKYPSIMGINLLNRNVYFLNSLDAINEAFGKQGDIFAGRPITEFNMFNYIHGKSGLIANEGEVWRVQQKFMIIKLSGLGMGKNDFSFTIHEICDDLINYISEEKELTNLWFYLSNFTSNVITTLLYGKKYKPSDPTYQKLVDCCDAVNGGGNNLGYYLTGPVAEIILKKSNREAWYHFNNSVNALFDFVAERMKERIDENVTGECSTILDYCVKEMESSDSKLYTSKNISRNFLVMHIAGTDTTSSTLNFAFYFMASYPEIQNKVYNEIIDVFGEHYRVLFTDNLKVQYTRAVIAEIQRMACVVPLGLMHVNTENAKVCGYNFPKRSRFIANFQGLSRDKRYFKNPDVFDPNNFLDENGNYTPNKANMPYGLGIRKCLGYKLADMELFIAFTRLIQEFQWLSPNNEEMKMEFSDELIRFLSPFKIIAKKRK